MKFFFAVCLFGFACVSPWSVRADDGAPEGQRVKCHQCKGTGEGTSKAKEFCKECKGLGFHIVDNGAGHSKSRVSCRKCGGWGYKWVAAGVPCARCKGLGYTVAKPKIDPEKVKLAKEREAQEKKLREEEALRREVARYVAANNLSVVLQQESVSIPVGYCFNCSPATNHSEKAVYRVKVVEVMQDNQVLATLAKNRGFTYDDNVGSLFLIKFKVSGMVLRDNMKVDTYFKYAGDRFYKNKYGIRVKCRGFEEISKAEYKEFVQRNFRSQSNGRDK